VRWLPRRGRCRQAGDEVALDQGQTADEIQKEISTSPKHAGMKSLTADEVKDIAAYLGTLK